jgi:DNA (cytosine-5)-methyltransferase 1
VTLRILDLFSGIGGFSLGLERTGGFKTVAFCEIDSFCRKVLAKHWPEVPCYDDVRTLTGERLKADGVSVDVICGGFPCQDISPVGTRAGIDGASSRLWREFARLIRELRPGLAIVENSAALLNRGLGDVLRDLAESGYNAEWSVFSACMFGYPHTRERLYLLAYPDEQRQETCGSEGNEPYRIVASRSEHPEYLHQASILARRKEWFETPREPELARVADGVPDRVDRNGAIGNAVFPKIPELIGRAILASLKQAEAA